MSFILPDRLYVAVPIGRQGPCLHGVRLDVHGAGLVAVEGRPLATVLDQALRFMRSHRLASTRAILDDGRQRTIGELTVGRPGFAVVAQLELDLPGVAVSIDAG